MMIDTIKNETEYAAVYERSNGAKIYIHTSMAATTPVEREKAIELVRKAVWKSFALRMFNEQEEQ